MDYDDICYLPATELASEIRAKRLSSYEVVRSYLQKIECVNETLNAYVTLRGEEALRDAENADRLLMRGEPKGIIHGVPFSVKDVFYTKGLRTTAGSKVHENFIPREDSLVVSRLREAGGILLGKTNTPEFAYKATTENPLFGPTRNPWSLDKTAGGSSGGAAAATASGMSPLSLGSDGGGSIRIPASFCGIFGFKPSFGVVPLRPCFGAWRSLTHGGPITRNVRDAALMLDVMAGPHEVDLTSIPRLSGGFVSEVNGTRRKFRVGYSSDIAFALTDPDVLETVDAALSKLEDMGHAVEMASIHLGAAKGIFQTIVLAENAGVHCTDLEANRALMDEALVRFIEMGLQVSAMDYIQASLRRDELAATLASYFASYDLLLTPTVAVPPFPIGEPPRKIGGIRIDPLGWIPFTYPFNLTGNPAASVPCGMTSYGLPVGLQVIGPRHADAKVLDFCAQYEEARPWSQLRPGAGKPGGRGLTGISYQ